MTPSPRRGVVWAIASAWMAAAFMIPWKLAVGHGELSTIVLVMLVVAALFNTLVAPMSAPPANAMGSRFTALNWTLAVVLAALTLAGNLSSAAAISRISGPMLSVLQRSEVIVVAVLAWLVIGERVDRRFWLGAAVAAMGLVLVHGGSTTEVRGTGVFYGLISAGSFASISVLIRKYITQIEPITVNAMRLWISVLMWFAFYRTLPNLSDLNGPLVWYASLAALAGPGVSRLCLMFSARHVPARVTALVVLCAPVFTLLLTWLILGTWPSSRELLGGAVMLLGVAIPVTAHALARPSARENVGSPLA